MCNHGKYLLIVVLAIFIAGVMTQSAHAQRVRSQGRSSVSHSPSASTANRNAGANRDVNQNAGANRNANQNANANRNVNQNANANANRNVNQNTNVNRNVNVNQNVNVNHNVNVNTNGGYYGGSGGCCYHPVAAVAAVTAATMVTAAVIGSMVSSIPPDCTSVVVNGFSYRQCGSTWYQPQISGSTTTYVVVNPPQ